MRAIQTIVAVLIAVTLGMACSHGGTNGAMVANKVTDHSRNVCMEWDINTVQHIFLNEQVVRIIDMGHLNEIYIETTNRTYVISEGTTHWQDVMTFRNQAEKAGKEIPVLHVD